MEMALVLSLTRNKLVGGKTKIQLGLNQGPPGPLMSQLGGVSITGGGVMVSGA